MAYPSTAHLEAVGHATFFEQNGYIEEIITAHRKNMKRSLIDSAAEAAHTHVLAVFFR